MSVGKRFDKNHILQALADYVFAISLPFIPLLLMLLSAQSLENLPRFPVLLFIPLVAIATWYLGMKPAMVTTLSSAVILYIFFTINNFIIAVPSPEDTVQLALFLIAGFLIAVLIANGKRSMTILDYRRREKGFIEEILGLRHEAERAKKEIRSRDEFLSIASHELKTPLTSMLLQTQTALHNIRNVSLAHFSIGDLLQMLESVENQTKRLSKMINDLLNVSLITTGNLHLDPEEVDMATTIHGIIKDFSARLKRDGITLTYFPSETATGFWDKLRIEQAIANLLSNAIKYGNKKPIAIKSQRKNGSIRVSIKDEGIGISKENQRRVFGLYERGVTPEEYKGLGVGLYITHQIVKAHKGTIMVSSREGKGSEFILELPILKKT
ncbi:MAG: HAMP domain-containing sensor histidine kinase [bacterium]|nr:HAMP domain-containing sensor histidine kinase [bacterium]